MNAELGMYDFSYEGVSQLRFRVNLESQRGILSITIGLYCHNKEVIQY